MTEPVPPAVRAQILATEHWGLLAVRSQTWSEVMGRITSQLMFTSASLLFLALVAGQGGGYTQTFRLLAVVLGLTLLITGTLTAFRVSNASQEDYMFIKGMNRLRAAYLEIDPSLAPYFITGVTDDDVGIGQTYTMGPVRNASQVAASAAIFITVVNTIVAGGVTGFLLWPLGTWPAAVAGVLVGLGHFAAWVGVGWHNWQVNLTPEWTRFPSTPAPDADAQPRTRPG